VGISNAGVIIGVDNEHDPNTSFLYKDGIFKVIAVPNSFQTLVKGISPDGTITGWVNVIGSEGIQRGFIARCK
jgi:hypothetical protein